MEPKHVMKRSINHILSDLDRVGTIVRMVEKELDEIGSRIHPASKVADMKEKLGEIHARLDGMREFVLHCRLEASEVQVAEEVDVWL
jgi:hypothetical protein